MIETRETLELLEQLRLDGTSAGTAMPVADLAALVEALLLVSPEPPTIDDLAIAAEVSTARIGEALAELETRPNRGWIVQQHGAQLHLATAPRFAPQISAYLGLEREGKLSSAALETLAIVAYQQPVTRSEIEAIRGVDCSGVLATLHQRELVEHVSRLAAIGNPFQYGTTIGFLKLFGLNSLDDLPALGQFDGSDGAELLDLAMAAGTAVLEPTNDTPATDNESGS